jgi:hypothetical protein
VATGLYLRVGQAPSLGQQMVMATVHDRDDGITHS